MISHIISASRRTDIPAFHADWFMQCIRSGGCEVRNPFNSTLQSVDLTPDAVQAIILWTRNPEPMFVHIPKLLDQYRLACQFTVLEYPVEIHPGSPPLQKSIDRLLRLSSILPAGAVVWRYDPIILNDRFGPDYHLKRFDFIAGRLKDNVRCCITSFYDAYKKTERRIQKMLRSSGTTWRMADEMQKKDLVAELTRIAQANRMTLKLCCESDLLAHPDQQAHCIGPDIIESAGVPGRVIPPIHPTRPGCGCLRSIDIGTYGTCNHGCIYCYASR